MIIAYVVKYWSRGIILKLEGHLDHRTHPGFISGGVRHGYGKYFLTEDAARRWCEIQSKRHARYLRQKATEILKLKFKVK